MMTRPPQPTLRAEPDGQALLVLIPQEGHRWEFQRLLGWSTGVPQVQRLVLDGDESGDMQDYI